MTIEEAFYNLVKHFSLLFSVYGNDKLIERNKVCGKENNAVKDENEVKIKSLQKALEILNCFVEKQPLGVTEISEYLGLYKSNVYNILTTFKSMNYLEQDPVSGKYKLGTALFSLSRALKENLTINKIALPYMQRIVEETKEMVYLSIPKNDELIYLEVVHPMQKFYSVGGPVMGETAKLYCTGAGKAILAQMPDADVEQILSGKLESYTDYTITDKDLLWEEIKAARENGYAVDNMEVVLGMKCIGIAIMNHMGTVECGISISAPSLRMEPKKIVEFAQILKRYKFEIEQFL